MTIGLFIPTLLLQFILASTLIIIIYGIVGLFAFWIEEVAPIFWIVDKSVMVLGGSYLPVALFPNFLYKIAIYSPFGASMFVSQIVYDTWKVNWMGLVLIQIFWIIILGIFMIWLFKRAKDKVSVNGG